VFVYLNFYRKVLLLLSEPAYVREGCGGSSSRLSRHTSGPPPLLTFRLVESPSGSIQDPQCSLKTSFLRSWSWTKRSWSWPWTVLKIWKIAVLRAKRF